MKAGHPRGAFALWQLSLGRVVGALAVVLLQLPLAGSASVQAAAPSGPTPGTRPSSGPLAATAAASASSLAPLINVTGHVSVSVDGLASNNPAGGPIMVQKHSGATVRQALLFAASTGFTGYVPVNGDVTVDGLPVTWDAAHTIPNSISSYNVLADVTPMVKTKIDSASVGSVAFTVAEPNHTLLIDGEILAVIFDDPTVTFNKSVSLLYGAQSTTGDTFNVALSAPIDKSDPNQQLTFGLGISFGYQAPGVLGQYSLIDVNGSRLSSSAGGQDDCDQKYNAVPNFASCGNGSLLTVGGIGDDTSNPVNPNATPQDTCVPRCDDELYNLQPFVNNGDTSFTIHTLNPSNDDNIFFAWLLTNPPATVTTGAGTCNEAGQMVSNSSLSYDQWNLEYGISKCEGLVISNVGLGSRLMAERMSLPYLDLQTCTGQSGAPHSVSDCATSVLRHIALRPSGYEPQTDPTAFTRVQLVSPSGSPEVFYSAAPKTAPCNGNRLCDHVNIQAQYQISLSPPTNTIADQYLLVTQRYEFYRDFKEANNPKALACEPSQEGPSLGPLSDCGRWKPVVFYQYHRGNSNQILVSLNAAERLHYTPDSLALRGSTFIRDCEPGAPEVGCHGTGTVLGAKLEVFHDPLTGAEENPIPHETVIRAVQATDAGVVGNKAGRYDNVHLTPKSDVGLPIPPPGCPECAHMHWRWGGNLSSNATFGSGKPLLGDAEPGALPANSRQQLDVALVAYHSEELSPRNFMDDLVVGANRNQLDMHQSTPTAFSGGASQGTETLNYPPGSCYKADDLRSWGQCGQVVWLSATSFALNVNASGVGDEDSDTFFAFGGFFCATCSDGQYSDFLGFKPHYSPGQNALGNMSRGQQLRIAFGPLPGQLPSGVTTQLFDVLPAGMTNITVKINQVSSSQFSQNLISCSQSVLSSGQTEVNCQIKQPSSPNGLPPPCTNNTNGNFDGNTTAGACIVISGNVATSPGDYENLVHVVWTDPSVLVAGNLRQIAKITVH